jgi:HK97 family phage prohead protease
MTLLTRTHTAAHPRDGAELPIGHSVELRDQPDGLHGAWHVSDTDTGNEVLTLVRDGVPLGLSIGFIPERETWNHNRTRVVRLTAVLDHVAVVRVPAYPDAKIAAVRAAQPSSTPLLHGPSCPRQPSPGNRGAPTAATGATTPTRSPATTCGGPRSRSTTSRSSAGDATRDEVRGELPAPAARPERDAPTAARAPSR